MRLEEFASAADALELWKMISDNTWTELMQAIESDKEQDSIPTMASSPLKWPAMPAVPTKPIAPFQPRAAGSKRKATTKIKGTKAKAPKAVLPKVPVPVPPKPMPVAKSLATRTVAAKPQLYKPMNTAKPIQYPSGLNWARADQAMNQKGSDALKPDEKRPPTQAELKNSNR